MKVQNNPLNTIKGTDTQKSDRVDLTKAKGAKKVSEDFAAASSSAIAPRDIKDSARVELSQRAQDMKKIKAMALNTPDVDPQKVAKFQKLIDEGKYKVDTAAVADKMVDEFLINEE